MLLCVFRLILTTWILLQRSFDCSQYPQISYAFYDGLGEPTSFLYANGWIEARCEAPSTNPDSSVQLKADLKNSDVVLEQGNGSVSSNVSLNKFEYEKLFCYSKTKTSESKLAITYRLCDPMLLIPPITTCGEKEVCLKTANSNAICKKISALSCDVSNQHLLKEKYICIQKLNPTTHQQGLCQATKTNTNNAKFSGITSGDNTCGNYESLKLNGKIVAEESIWLQSITNKKFTAEFTGITKMFTEGRCQLRIEGGLFLLANGAPKNLTEVDNKNTLVLPLDLSVIKRQSLPIKGKLICYVKTLVGSKTTSAYLFLFDNEQFKISTKKTPVAGKTGSSSLNCSIDLIDGILFTVAWDKEPDSYEDKNWVIKEVTNRFDDVSKKHTCYAVGFAYQHPYKIKLQKLPVPSIKDVLEIQRAQDSKGPENGPIPGGKNESGSNVEKDSASKDESSDNDPMLIGIFVAILVLVALAIVGFLASKYMRKRTKRNFFRMCRKDKQHCLNAEYLTSISKNVLGQVGIASYGEFSMFKLLSDSEKFVKCREEVEELAKIPAPKHAQVGYLSTSIMAKEAIVRRTWANKGDPRCRLEDTKPQAVDPTKPVQGLHMNTITDCFGKEKFIASAAPQEHELPLYFQTLFEKKVTLIVCLSDEHAEPNQLTKFWVSSDSIDYGGFGVTALLITENPEVSYVAELSVTKKTTEETITISFVWVMDFHTLRGTFDVTEVWKLHNIVWENDPGDASTESLIVVQCIDGLIRTGVFIAVELGIQFLDKFGLPLNFFQIIKKLRSERANSVTDLVDYVHALFSLARYRIVSLQAAGMVNDPTTTIPPLPHLNFLKKSTKNTKSFKGKSAFQQKGGKKSKARGITLTGEVMVLPISAPITGPVVSTNTKSSNPGTPTKTPRSSNSKAPTKTPISSSPETLAESQIAKSKK